MPRKKKSSRKQKVDKKSKFYLLDSYSSINDIDRWNKKQEDLLKFHWDYYNELAFQRLKYKDEIRQSLMESASFGFTFNSWQRAVKYKYSLEPLSVEGSLKNIVGGRFNIGNLDKTHFSSFPALYVASNKTTVFQELLSQRFDLTNKGQAFDFALADASSITNVAINGQLESVINLNNRNALKPFVNIIKDFSLPEIFQKRADQLNFGELRLLRTVPQLINEILHYNWREWPMLFDTPSVSQIFGQLVADAGIEGILYPSKFTGKDCLAIFPQNFKCKGSFVELKDEAPKETKIRRLDSIVWNSLYS